MFRFLLTLIYSLLLLSLSGITNLALAAVSCNDPIYAGTTIKYSDALDHFLYINGNTYAIAKSAITGNGAAPDGYFAMSANIDAQYFYTGVDNGSLRKLLASGIYGAAVPVIIPDAATQSFITTRYGQYLGKASTSQSTYVNAWKDYGAGAPFTQITGGALTFTNWSSGNTPNVSQITVPQDVTMGSDGYWVNGEDGQCLAQIVEFPGQQLDCAVDMTPPATPSPSPPPSPTGSGQVCMQDLNGDGTIEPNEEAACVQTAQGLFCPIGAVPCSTVTGSPLCPTGTTLNNAANMCQVAPTVVCGTGYSWNASIDLCIDPPTCPGGGTFNSVTNQCEKLVSVTCPSGYTYSSSLGICWMAVNCQGGTYVPSRDRCELPVSNGCTDPTYTYVAADSRCEKAPVCSQGTYNTTYGLCLQNYTPGCPTGYSFVATRNRCEETPICSQGTFNANDNECEWTTTTTYAATPNYSCPSGGTLSGSTCTVTYAATSSVTGAGNFTVPVCIYMGADMDRYLAPCGGSANGVIGYLASSTFSGGVCVSTLQNSDFQQLYVPCNEASSGTPVAGYMASSSFSGSVSAYTFMDASMETYYTTSGSTGAAGYLASSSGTYGGTITYTCNAGDTLSGTTCTHTYTASATYACKAGDTLTGTTCYHNALNQASPNCPNGTMDFTNHVCYAADTFQCPTGMTYDSAANLCSEAATCSNGVLDPVKNVCYQGSSASCSAPWALDTSNDVCYSPPVCQNGAFVASAGDCQATVTQNCGAYTWNAVENKCIQAVTCPKDPSFSQNATIAFSSTLSECVSQAEHDCIAQTSYTGLPVEMCQAVPVCSGSGVYDPVQHTCNMGTSCPLGAQYTCMSYNGTLQCSANQCFNPANPPGGQTIDNGSTSMYTNDAQNPDGSCAGQILIFNGMPSRCRPPGLTVGELNNCCASSQVMAENVGDTFDAYGAYQTLATMWDMAEVGYYSYLASQGLITSTSFAATGGLTIEGSTLAGEAFSTTISGAATETGVIAGTQAGSTVTATAAVTSGEEAYLGAMLNPATIVVAIIVMIVMKVLMGGGCDNRDIQCGESVASKDCHYVGDYCEKHWFFGCVQSAKGYCCFNSMMARIIQEQGRPQLTAFGPTGDWGAPDNPNCVGFTPEQFEAIDFSKIDFSEYISSVIQQDVTQTNVTNAQTTIQANIQNTLSNQQSKP